MAPPQLGYHADDALLQRIFAGADADGSRSLNVHEFLAVLAILHILKARPPPPPRRLGHGMQPSLRTAGMRCVPAVALFPCTATGCALLCVHAAVGSAVAAASPCCC